MSLFISRSFLFGLVLTSLSCSSNHYVEIKNNRSKPIVVSYMKERTQGFTFEYIIIHPGEIKRRPDIQGTTWGLDLPLLQLYAKFNSFESSININENLNDHHFTSFYFPEEYNDFLDEWTDRYYHTKLFTPTHSIIDLNQDGSVVMTFQCQSYLLSDKSETDSK